LNYPIKISAVSYLNTLPFHFGLENSNIIKEKIVLYKDIPSVCARKLIKDEVDIGLIPVAEIPKISSAKIISDYCIGAVGSVNTVLLLSDVPLNEIENIYLDYQSRTSVNLLKILVKDFWKIRPSYLETSEGYEEDISAGNAGLIIGDRAFKYMGKFKYVYDLAEEWKKYQRMPFVFAAWVSNKLLPEEFIEEFNTSLKFGLNNIEFISEQYLSANPGIKIDVFNYLKNDISYFLDAEKRRGLNTFLKMLKSI